MTFMTDFFVNYVLAWFPLVGFTYKHGGSFLRNYPTRRENEQDCSCRAHLNVLKSSSPLKMSHPPLHSSFLFFGQEIAHAGLITYSHSESIKCNWFVSLYRGIAVSGCFSDKLRRKSPYIRVSLLQRKISIILQTFKEYNSSIIM